MKASVIVPTYNAEGTIGSCLESLSKQSFKDFEVIVVDDGSNDKTAGIVKSFPKARFVKQQHAGPAVARNRGAKLASGKVIVFVDSDCVAERQWLEEIVGPFMDGKIAGVQGRYKSKQRELVARLIQLEIEQRYEKMAKREYIDFVGTYSAAYRKDVFLEMNGFDESFPIASGEDTDLSFRIHGKGHKIVFKPEAVVFHSHPTGFWKYLKVKFFRAFWRTKVYKRHKGKMVKDAYTSQIVKVQTALFLFGIFLMGMGLVYPPYLSWVVWPFALLLLSTLPFAVWSLRRDAAVALCSVPVSLFRTAAFGFGLVFGTARELVSR